MTETRLRFDKGMAKTVITLLLFAAVVAFLLGLVNHITADRIADYRAEKTLAAMKAVLPSNEYSQLVYEGDPTVAAVFRAGDQGWIFEVTPSGFGGLIDMLVGVDTGGKVTGVSIISMSETSGLGANASRESFRSQFSGQSGTVALSKEGGSIDALTGATVTSSAVVRGVNAAIGAAAEAQREEAGK